MSHVKVQPRILEWARERSGIGVDELVGQFPKYLAWEAGETGPTLKQLEKLARKTTTPLGYFFLSKPPEEKLPVPDFRTVDDGGVKRPSPNLLETVHLMQRRQAWMRDFLIEEGAAPLPFIGSMTTQAGVEAVAESIREKLGLSEIWASFHSSWTEALRALRMSIEEIGVLVVFNGVVENNGHRKLDANEFRGFVLLDRYAPLLFVNGADAKGAQMFTLAHELAHLWIGAEGVFSLDGLMPSDHQTERFCNQVAAEFLVPAQRLAQIWRDALRQEEPFQYLAREFKVSSVVAARRALDLKLIEREDFFAFYRAYLEDDRRRKEDKKSKGKSSGDFYKTQNVRIGARFGRAIAQAVQEGRVSFGEAYRLTGLHGKTFDRFMSSVTDRFVG